MVHFFGVPAEGTECVVSGTFKRIFKIGKRHDKDFGLSNRRIKGIDAFFIFKRIEKREDTAFAANMHDFFVTIDIGVVEFYGSAFNKHNLIGRIPVVKNDLSRAVSTLDSVRELLFNLSWSEYVHTSIVTYSPLFG